ncbi:MAG: hypothetical protein ACKOPS_20615 [Cyanobium sp.]
MIHEGSGGGEISEIQEVAGVLCASERNQRLPIQFGGGGEVGLRGRHLAPGMGGTGPAAKRAPLTPVILGSPPGLVCEPLGFGQVAQGQGNLTAVEKTDRRIVWLSQCCFPAVIQLPQGLGLGQAAELASKESEIIDQKRSPP